MAETARERLARLKKEEEEEQAKLAQYQEKEAKANAEYRQQKAQQSAEIAARLDTAPQEKNEQSAQVAARLDQTISSPDLDYAVDSWNSAYAARNLDNGNYAATGGTKQKEIAQRAREYKENLKSAQVAANLDNSLMTKATRDNQKASIDRAMDLLQNRMEIAKNANQMDDYNLAQERYAYFAERAQGLNNPLRTAYDVVGRGAGQFNQMAYGTLDVLANAIPTVEGAIFGVDKDATFTGQLLKPITDATGKLKSYVDTTTQNLDEQVKEDTKYSGKAAQIAADVGSGVVAALPNAALAMLTMGGSTAAQLGAPVSGLSGTVSNAATKMLTNPMFKVSFAQSLGGGYNEAKEAGASDMEALTAATLSGLFNAAVEAGGGVETLPEEIRGADLSTTRKAWSWLVSTLSEGGEEVVQGVISGLTNKAVFDSGKELFSMENPDAVINPRRMGQEFGMGAAIGGAMSGGQIALDAVMPQIQQKQTQQNEQTGQPQQAVQKPAQTSAVAPTTQVEQDAAVAATTPNMQHTPPIAEFRQTASEILNDGIFDSPIYGEALEQTGLKRSDVREALRAVARNNIAAASDPKVQTVLGAIQKVDAQAAEAQAKAPTQATPEQAASEVVSRVAGKNENTTNTAPEMQADVRRNEQGAQPAMGAADYGFSGEIGGWKRDADTFVKDTEIPKHDKEGRTVSDSAGSMFSANVPNETKEYIERMSYLGKLNVGHDTNKAQVQRVHDAIAKDGFDNVYTKTITEIEDGKASGDLTARAWVLFVQAANRGDSAKAATLAKAINKNAGNSAHALQANAIYYKLSPEGRYASIARTVDKINEEISHEGRKDTGLYDVPESAKLNVTKAIEDERETALRLLENLYKTFNKKGRNHGIPVELWSTEVGNQLASVLEKNKKPGSARPQTVAKALRRDLQIFAQNYMSKNTPAGIQYNAARALENFLNNREQYQEAWKQAQATLREKYADDPAMLEALQDFMSNDISIEQLEHGIDRDIAKAIREIGTKTSEIFKQSPDDRVVVGRQVVDMLMRDHQLSEEDAKTMSDFIMDRFFRQMNTELEKSSARAAKQREKQQQKKQREAEREAAREAKKHGVPVEDWLQEIGNEVAKVLGATPSAPKPKPISKTIKQDILRFATDYKPKKPVQKRTAMDTLTDFLANRDEYVRAWSAAREAYKSQYDADPEGFAGATMTFGGTGSDAVMTQAIVEEVTEQEVKNLGFNARTFLEGQNVRESQIADSIIKKTGASGADATMIRDAVSRYFNERFDSEKGRGSVDAKIQEKLHDIGMKMSDIIRSSPGDKNAVANRVASMMVKDYNISQADAQRLSASIIDRFNARMNEAAEEALKNYVKPKDKNAQKTLDKRFREMVNMGAFSGSNYADQVAEKLFGNVVKLDPDLIERYKNTTDPDAVRALEKEIYKSVGKQIPSNFKDKWNAWRHMSMLGTFKAPERNLIGNAAGLVMRKTSNAFSAVGQIAINKDKRTRSVVPAGRKLRQVAKADVKNVEQELKGIGKNHIVNDQIEEARQIFTPHLANAVRKAFPELPEKADNISLEGIRKLINGAMSDGMFSRPAYVDSLSSFLKARGYTAEDFTGNGMTEAQKAEAREHAIADALKATYRDLNLISELITSTRFKPDAAKTRFGKVGMEVANKGLEGIMPYLKTPANILARGIEYDPVLGTATTIFKAAYAKHNGDFKATDLVDDISKVLTGGVIATIGYFMRANNLIKGSYKDEDQERLEGQQEYSLMIGGKSIPIDWMAPFCMPLFVGAELYNVLNRDEDDSAPLTSKVASSLNSISSAIMNTSMLDGLQDTIDNVKYADSAPIALVANAALGYLGQHIPTLFGQIERAINSPVQETTFIDESNKWLDADWQRALGSLSKKIPGWDYNQIPYIDAWGRTTDNGGVKKRLVNQLINPANTSKINATPVDKEIKWLEKETKKNYTPSRAPRVITIDGEKIILTANEYITYAQAKGQNDWTFRQNLIDSDAYKELDAETRGKAQNFSESLANALAIKEAGFNDPDMPEWQKELIGADAETITRVLTEKAVDSQAGMLGENKYLGLETLLDNKSIDDQLALACLPDPAHEAYTTHCEKADISVQQFLDMYGSAVAAGEKTADQKQYVLDTVAAMGITTAEKSALAKAACQAIGSAKIPQQWFVEIGDNRAIIDQMDDEEREKYNSYIKNSKVNMATYVDFAEYCSSEEAKAKTDVAGNEIQGESRQDHIERYLNNNIKSDAEKARLFCTQFSENSCPKDWFIDAFGVEKAEEYINKDYQEKYDTNVKGKLTDPVHYFELEKYITSSQEKADRKPGEEKMDHIKRWIANLDIPDSEKNILFLGFYKQKNLPRNWDEWKD